MRFLILLLALTFPAFAFADENPKPDDTISLQISTEGWVTTATAKVTVSAHAAVSSENSGSTRDTMLKAVKQVADAEWRITNFNRSQSDTGLEEWYAEFEARLPESALGGLNDKLKKASKAGLQLSVGNIDFTPTLAENEAVRSTLRKQLMDKANAELKNVQASFPDRGYRIAEINFDGMVPVMAQQRMMMAKAGRAPAPMMAESAADSSNGGGVQTAQQMHLSAQVTFAALAPVLDAKK